MAIVTSFSREISREVAVHAGAHRSKVEVRGKRVELTSIGQVCQLLTALV
jgi:hypothetical protein